MNSVKSLCKLLSKLLIFFRLHLISHSSFNYFQYRHYTTAAFLIYQNRLEKLCSCLHESKIFHQNIFLMFDTFFNLFFRSSHSTARLQSKSSKLRSRRRLAHVTPPTVSVSSATIQSKRISNTISTRSLNSVTSSQSGRPPCAKKVPVNSKIHASYS